MSDYDLLDGVDSDSLCSEGHSSCLGEPVHHTLAHGVRQSIMQRPQTCQTGHVDDGSLGLLQVRDSCLGHHEHWPHKDIVTPVKVINLTRINVPGPCGSSIVDLLSKEYISWNYGNIGDENLITPTYDMIAICVWIRSCSYLPIYQVFQNGWWLNSLFSQHLLWLWHLQL